MHCHFMFGINAPTGFETIIDAVIKQLLAPYVTERIHAGQRVRFVANGAIQYCTSADRL